MTIIDTPQGIDHFRMAATIAALRIEVATGMKMHRGVSALRMAQMYGCPKNTKKAALPWMEAFYKETYGWAYGSKP